MGCMGSKLSEYDVEKASIQELLKKRDDELTDEDRAEMKSFSEKYESQFKRIDEALIMIDLKLTGKDQKVEQPIVSNPQEEYDISMLKLKTVMKKMEQSIKKLEGECAHFHKLAIENRENNKETCEMYLKLEKKGKKVIDAVLNRMNCIEDKKQVLTEMGATTENISTIRDVVGGLEEIQKHIGSVEDLEEIAERFNALDDTMHDFTDAMEPLDMDMDEEEMYAELEEEMAKDAAKAALPDAPTVIHKGMIDSAKEQRGISENKGEATKAAVLEE